MKATAVLHAVGTLDLRAPPLRGLPNIHTWRPDAVHDHQRTTWHAGGVVEAGRSRAIGRPENARPFVSRRSPG
jgi:hypothetical protein